MYALPFGQNACRDRRVDAGGRARWTLSSCLNCRHRTPRIQEASLWIWIGIVQCPVSDVLNQLWTPAAVCGFIRGRTCQVRVYLEVRRVLVSQLNPLRILVFPPSRWTPLSIGLLPRILQKDQKDSEGCPRSMHHVNMDSGSTQQLNAWALHVGPPIDEYYLVIPTAASRRKDILTWPDCASSENLLRMPGHKIPALKISETGRILCYKFAGIPILPLVARQSSSITAKWKWTPNRRNQDSQWRCSKLDI
ncbi:hypothetical protein B0H13DRAFT_1893675 [Mycena leptocephala]|nr:hypothetical protein B0H13DRAFT_1893675 [Mycena leptocephala]